MVRKTGTLTDYVYDLIRQSILSGEFVPGERLKETHLAERYEVSPTPIREALGRLTQDGFISMDRYRGASVRVYTEEDLRNLYDIRCMLEVPALRTAISQMTNTDLPAIENHVQLGMRAIDNKGHESFEQIDLDFHESLMHCTKNPYLVVITRNNHEKIQTIRKMVVPSSTVSGQSQIEHEQLYAALLERDSSKAEEILRHHIRRTMQEVLLCMQK